MRPVLPRQLVDNLNMGAPVRPWDVALQESPKIAASRHVSGYVGGSYVSVEVEPADFSHFSHRVSGFVRGEAVAFYAGKLDGDLDISTAVPHLDQATAEAIWRIVASELGLT